MAHTKKVKGLYIKVSHSVHPVLYAGIFFFNFWYQEYSTTLRELIASWILFYILIRKGQPCLLTCCTANYTLHEKFPLDFMFSTIISA